MLEGQTSFFDPKCIYASLAACISASLTERNDYVNQYRYTYYNSIVEGVSNIKSRLS